MSTTHDTKGQEILCIADEIRVRIHLAGMEAKEAWAKLEPKVMDFGRDLESITGKASDEWDKLATGLFRELKHLNERVFK